MALSPRILALGALLVTLLLAGAVHACAAGPAAGREPAPPSPSPSPAPEPHLAESPAASDGVDVLAAVVVARRVCTLVDRRSYAAVRWLFADGARWPAGLWHRLRRVRFRSARVVAVQGGPAPIVRLNVRVATPSSRRGLRTLAFTLGRVGTDGDWLVYAVSTPIPPRERGPSCPAVLSPPAGFSPA
ncbi:MAG TPA: hypothetical protein VLA35_01935 [Thermoleophilia bacterium]|nr:hypothetical protein [Thermoleophilia bacterium]